MELYDEVRCNRQLSYLPLAGRAFHTPSLTRTLDRFTITREGRLLFQVVRYEYPAPSHDLLDPQEPVPTGEIDMAFHGDLVLVTEKARQYVARFTHGTLEWVRPLAQLPEPQQTLLRCNRRAHAP